MWTLRGRRAVAAGHRKLVVAQGNLDPGDEFDAVLAGRGGHLGVAVRGVVIRQGNGAQPEFVGLGRQLTGRIRAVGERRVSVQVNHRVRLLNEPEWARDAVRDWASASRPRDP